VPHDNHRSLRQWKMSTHSIRKCATKPCQVIVSSHDNSIWRHTLLERRSLRLARLTHSGLPVDLEHTNDVRNGRTYRKALESGANPDVQLWGDGRQ
jgi:hypothetical protein